MSDILFTFDFLYFWEEVHPHDLGARSSSFESHSRNYSCPLSPVTLLTEIEVNTHKGRQWRHRLGRSGDVQGKDVTSAFTPLACLHCCVSDSYTPSNHWSGLREHSHLPISPGGIYIHKCDCSPMTAHLPLSVWGNFGKGERECWHWPMLAEWLWLMVMS